MSRREEKLSVGSFYSASFFFLPFFLFVDRENAQYKNDLFYIMNKEVTMHIHSHKKLKIIKNEFFSNKNHVLCFFLSLNAILDYYFIQQKGKNNFLGPFVIVMIKFKVVSVENV